MHSPRNSLGKHNVRSAKTSRAQTGLPESPVDNRSCICRQIHQREHLLGSQIGVESKAKLAAHRLRPPIDTAFLHLVIYFYAQRLQYLVLNRLSEDDYFGGENATISLAAR
jgi:hypothetical protein